MLNCDKSQVQCKQQLHWLKTKDRILLHHFGINPSRQVFPAGEPEFVRLHLHTQSSAPACCGHTPAAPQSREEPCSQRTSLRSAMVRFMPASCFHTGSARFRLRGLPVRIAMPSSTPADTARRSTLRTDQTISRHRAQERIRQTKRA